MNISKKLITISILFSVAIVWFIFLKPSIDGQLSKTPWCVDAIYYNNKLIGPKTLNAVYMVYSNGKKPCYENIDFRNNGDLMLPGVHTRMIEGAWKLDRDKNLQLDADTLETIFKGTYEITISEDKLSLKSNTTLIKAHLDKTEATALF